jgi:hypothetical protein
VFRLQDRMAHCVSPTRWKSLVVQHSAGLEREADPSQPLLKSRAGAQAVEFRVHFEEDQSIPATLWFQAVVRLSTLAWNLSSLALSSYTFLVYSPGTGVAVKTLDLSLGNEETCDIRSARTEVCDIRSLSGSDGGWCMGWTIQVVEQAQLNLRS